MIFKTNKKLTGQNDLFLKCPLFGQTPKCLVFYRYKVPFRIPCKTLHPMVSVTEHSTNMLNVKIIFFKVTLLN